MSLFYLKGIAMNPEQQALDRMKQLVTILQDNLSTIEQMNDSIIESKSDKALELRKKAFEQWEQDKDLSADVSSQRLIDNLQSALDQK